MRVRVYAAAAVLGLALLSACAPGEPDATLVAEHAALSTQVADVRNTATYAADRNLQTLEAAATAIAGAESDRLRLSGTLEALGVDPLRVTPGVFAPTPVPTSAPAGPGASSLDPSLGAAALALTPGSGPVLYNIVIAEGVGENDCALGSVTNFPSTAPSIYIVATAANIAPGMVISSTWFVGAEERIRYDFTPDFAINQNCIWFFMDPADTPFTPGNWTVQLAINDQPQGTPVAFTISE